MIDGIQREAQQKKLAEMERADMRSTALASSQSDDHLNLNTANMSSSGDSKHLQSSTVNRTPSTANRAQPINTAASHDMSQVQLLHFLILLFL